MNYLKQNHLSLLIILWLIVSAFSHSDSLTSGAVLNQLSTYTNPVYLSQGVSTGGAVLASSTSVSSNLSATELTQYGSIMMTPNLTGGLTISLPTKGALTGLNPAFIPNSGDRITKYIFNATTTTNAWITVAGASGTIVRYAVATSTIGNNRAFAGENMKLDFWRSGTTTDIYVDVTVYHGL